MSNSTIVNLAANPEHTPDCILSVGDECRLVNKANNSTIYCTVSAVIDIGDSFRYDLVSIHGGILEDVECRLIWPSIKHHSLNYSGPDRYTKSRIVSLKSFQTKKQSFSLSDSVQVRLFESGELIQCVVNTVIHQLDKTLYNLSTQDGATLERVGGEFMLKTFTNAQTNNEVQLMKSFVYTSAERDDYFLIDHNLNSEDLSITLYRKSIGGIQDKWMLITEDIKMLEVSSLNEIRLSLYSNEMVKVVIIAV